MTRAFLHLSLPFILLFTAALSFIHDQPHSDASELRDVLFHEECSTPCFMGLYPGQTSSYDAVTLLYGHPWVESVDNRLVGGQGGYMYWQWNNSAPAWIDTDSWRVIWVNRGRVDQMWVDTKFALGELLLQLGNPDIKIVDENIDYGHGLYQYRGVYGAVSLVAVSWQQCMAADPYRTNTILKFREVIGTEALNSMYYLDQWKYTFNNCKNRH